MSDGLRFIINSLLAVVGALMLTTAEGGDRNILPPELRSFSSPSGAYVFEVRTVDAWKSPQSRVELFAVNADARRSCWAAVLPHRYGPGTAFVSDTGHVLLIDEWMKTLSDSAIMLYAKNGTLIIRHSVSDIETVSGVHRADLATRAHAGAWMSAPPKLSPSHDAVLLEGGGVPLVVNLLTGLLERAGQ